MALSPPWGLTKDKQPLITDDRTDAHAHRPGQRPTPAWEQVSSLTTATNDIIAHSSSLYQEMPVFMLNLTPRDHHLILGFSARRHPLLCQICFSFKLLFTCPGLGVFTSRPLCKSPFFFFSSFMFLFCLKKSPWYHKKTKEGLHGSVSRRSHSMPPVSDMVMLLLSFIFFYFPAFYWVGLVLFIQPPFPTLLY